MSNFFKFITILCVSAIFCVSCKDKIDIPDTSQISADVKLIRFEKELFAVDTLQLDAGLTALKNKYPAFYQLYFTNILPLTQDSSALKGAIKAFISDPQMKKLKDTTELVIGNDQQIQEQLNQAVKNIKYYFPGFNDPVFYTFISEYSYQNFIFDDQNKDGIGIGLDMFLGAEFDYKKLDPQNSNFSDYITRTFNKDHIVPKTVQTIIDDMAGYHQGNRLIDFMLANGKKLYLKKKFLPELNDTLIFEYTKAQMKWVEDNELEMWSFFIDENLMYESAMHKINKYINLSPNAPGMPKEAPGKTGNYIGYKIISSFMEKNPDLSLEALLLENDSDEILTSANYKPKRK